jgi:sodium-coupled neutral amino acid transporter 11
MDPDELDEASVHELEHHVTSQHHDQRMPLLVGLFDSSAAQRSLNRPMQMSSTNGNSVVIGEDSLDLEEIAAKRTAGGGLIDSIANMANSILGAGVLPSFQF